MRKHLLSFVALAFVALGLNAQTWTKPSKASVVKPYAVSLADHLTAQEDLSPSLDITNAVYLFNVVGEGFLGGGNSWGTRASFGVASGGDNRPDLPYFIADVTEAFVDVSGYTLEELQEVGDNAYLLYSPKSKNNYLTFRDDALNCWVDLGSQTHYGQYWRIEEAETNVYRIKSPKLHPTYGESEIYPNWQYEYFGYDGGDNNLISANIDPRKEGVGVDWWLISPEGYEAFKNSETMLNALLALYEQAKIIVDENLGEYGVTYEEYTDVYNGTDIDAINAATTELAAKVVEARKTKAWATGSEENPSDVTFLLVNPNMSEGYTTNSAGKQIPNGWTVDVPGAENYGLQGNTYNYNTSETTEDDPNYGVTISTFIEAWVPGKALGNGKICQVVELPLGKYVLGVDVMATNQYTSGDDREEATGFQLYALGGGIDNGVDVKSHNGRPEHYDFEFITAGGTTELGLRMVEAQGNWFGADNFTLKYKGNDIDPFYISLPSLIESSEAAYEDIDAVIANADIKADFSTALDEAKDAINSTDADFESIYNALFNAKNALDASVADYVRLAALIEKAENDVDTYEGFQISDDISDLLDTYNPAYEDGTATSEQIEEWVAAYEPALLEGVKAAMAEASEEKPLCINVLGTNLDYANNETEPWISTSSAYKVNYHNGEVWQASYACTQTISELPAGKYTVRAKAFYRDGGNAATLEAYQNGEFDVTTYIVANSNKQPVVCLAAVAVESENAPENSYYAETADGSGIWMPNSQQSAEWAFNNRGEDLTCEVSTYLAKDGDLTFGTRNDDITTANNQWSVWTDFEIIYTGKSASGLYDQVQALMDEASNLMADATKNKAADKKIQDALNAGDTATPESTEEALTAIVDQLTEAIEYAETSIKLDAQLQEIFQTYYDLSNDPDIDGSDTGLLTLLETIGDIIEDSDKQYEDNDQIEQWMAEMPVKWFAYVMSQTGFETASEKDPMDITVLIINPDFEAAGSVREAVPPYWSVDAMGRNNGFQDNNTYSNADATIVLSNFVENWTPSGTLADGKISQKLAAALPEGYYFLEVDGQSNGAEGVYLMVETGSKTWTELITSDSPAHYQCEFYSNGTDIATVGVLVKETTAGWIAFDNFELKYIGKTPTVGVEGIEEIAPKTTVISNLAGQRVQKPVRGLYIINGKKVLIK